MSRILNFNIQNHIDTLKRGGGQIDFKIPTDFSNYDKLINDLKKILDNFENKYDKKLFILFHKDSIPAISNRLNDVFKTIFENNKLSYLSNTLKGNDKMGFYYEFSYYDIENGINRLEIIKEKIQSILDKFSLDIHTFFSILKDKNHEKNEFITSIVSIYFKNISHVSKTSLIRMLSLIQYQYDIICENDIDFTIENNDHTIAHFCSKEKANESLDLLLNNGIEAVKISSTLIDIKNDRKKIKIDGAIKITGYNVIKNNEKNEECFEIDMVQLVYEKFASEMTTNQVRVGVIDGGIGTGRLKKYIQYHPITEFVGYTEEDIPCGDHAEKVCSILLFHEMLNNDENKDNCNSPIVDLFDVCCDNMSAGRFYKLLEQIIEKYHKSIKIWNLSISSGATTCNNIIWSEGISNFGMILDELQKKYKVLFVVSSGNKENVNDKLITSPSDSMLAISVASANYDYSRTSYSLSGDYKNNRFYANKPDISTRAIDNNGNYYTFSSRGKSIDDGTSFATPIITRKVAQLYSDGVDLFAIPALLNAVAIFYNNKLTNVNELYIDDYLGYGCVPNNIELIRNMSDDNCVIVSKIKVKDYSQGFFKMKLPKTLDNQFDLNVILSVNVDAVFSKLAAFEYVEDTVRVQFGAVDPFSIGTNKLNVNWKLDEIFGDSDDGYTKEINLRKFFNKYKNRYSASKFLKKNKQSYIVSKGVKKDIENWGMTFTRNDIKSKRNDEIDVYFCLIISSINQNSIINEIYNANLIYLNNEISFDIDDDTIIFE